VFATGILRNSRIILALSLIAPVCAAAEFPDYPVHKAREYDISTGTAGVTIGIQPLEDLSEQQNYFHTELAPKGFIPVFVVIQNGSHEESFLFDKTKVRCGADDSNVATPKEGSKAGKALAASAIPFVGIFASMQIISNASQVQQNFLRKEMQSTTLSPGASAHGFLYVPVPKKTARQKIHLRVPITRAGTDDTFNLDLEF
jgi:hypothetical protein